MFAETVDEVEDVDLETLCPKTPTREAISGYVEVGALFSCLHGSEKRPRLGLTGSDEKEVVDQPHQQRRRDQ